jgi:SagB-type dehydrogenase family enzyme
MTAGNRDTSATWAFHDATKYVAARDAAGVERFLMGTAPELENPIWQEDWSLEPLPFKIYETLPPLALPGALTPSSPPALEALARTGGEPPGAPGRGGPDLAILARLGRLSLGLLGRQRTSASGRTVEFRAAGATGARYHLEHYFVCADLPDLAAGVYHYAAHDHSLRGLRAGDYRGVLREASGGAPALAQAPVVLATTSTFWRNAWRYKGRAYRHAFWDGGTALAHVFAVAAAAGLPTQVVLGYADAQVNALLGVDGEREAVLSLCAIGSPAPGPGPTVPEPAPLDLPTRPVSPREVTFPVIPRMHRTSSLHSGAEAAEWRANPLRRPPPPAQGALVPLRPLPEDRLPAAPVEEVILARRSTRHYDPRAAVAFEAFSTLLDRSSRGLAADCLASGAPPLHDTYLIVNAGEGLAPGVYLHRPERQAVELLREGDFRREARRLAVNQDYAGDAQVNCYYLTALPPVLERYGNRGYRLAQLECSLAAGRLHLGAHALGLRAVGSTSFDDEVTAFFSPHGAGKSYMFVTVFGRRRRRPRGRAAGQARQ